MKLMSLVVLLLALSANAFAGNSTLMISIDKAGVRSNEVDGAVRALNYKDPSMGTCFVESAVTQYVPYTNAPYYGVALVDFRWECDAYAQRFLTALNQSPKYTVWSNGPLGPFPAVTGNN
jgi:hypothetical protein